MKKDFYRAFEDRYRGSRELIRGRQEVYLDFLRPLAVVVENPQAVDLGCGRGEFLEILLAAGFRARGVDLDEGMLEACVRLGLPAEKNEAVKFLGQVPSNSQAVVSAFHVVEHIAFEQLRMLVAEARRVLVPGGIMILETPNPENPRVGHYGFFMDPTHQKPIPPPLLSFVAEHQGFQRVKILRLQESLRLEDNKPVSLLDVLTGVSPDYSIIAQKNGSSEVTASLDSAFSRKYGVQIEHLTGRYDDSLKQGLEEAAQKGLELKAQQEEVAKSVGGLKDELAQQRKAQQEEVAKSVGGLKDELAQQRKAQQEEVAKSVGGLKDELAKQREAQQKEVAKSVGGLKDELAQQHKAQQEEVAKSVGGLKEELAKQRRAQQEEVAKSVGGLKDELAKQRKAQQEEVAKSVGGLKEELAKQRRAQQEEVAKSVGGLKEELAKQRRAQQEEVAKSVGGLKDELAQQRKAQQEEVEKSVGEAKKEIVAEIHSLIRNLVEQGEKNRLEVSAAIASVKDAMEGRIVEVAQYASEIQDSVVAASSHPIFRLLPWYSFRDKMLKIQKPNWINKKTRPVVAPKRPGLLRRLDRSIRKRRKMLAAAWNFDPVWYLETYPEVSAACVEPLSHYINFGKQEGRQKNKSHKRIGVALIRMVKALRKSSLTTAPQIFLEQLESAFWVVTLKQTGKPLEGLAKFSARNRYDEFRLGEELKNKTNIKVLLKLPFGIQRVSISFEDKYKIQKTVVTKIVKISNAKKTQPEKIVNQNYDGLVDLSVKRARATVWRQLEARLRIKRKAIFSKHLLTIQRPALNESGGFPTVALALNQQADKIFKEISRRNG
jgi:O-antigen chain-terminating methyltransferase